MVNEADQWWVVANIDPLVGRDGVDLRIIRRLAEDEAKLAREANASIRRLAGAEYYARIVDSYKAIDSLTKQKSYHVRQVAELNLAAKQLGQAAKDFSDHLRKTIEDDFNIESPEFHEVEELLFRASANSPYKILLEIASPDTELFSSSDDNVVANTFTPDGSPDMQIPAVDFGTQLYAGVQSAEQILFHYLNIYKNRIHQFSRQLRMLAAEVDYGIPALFQSDTYDPENGVRELGKTSLDYLALHESVQLHLALKKGERLFQSIREVPNPASNPSENASPNPPDVNGESAKSAASATKDSSKSTTEESESAETREPEQVLDLRSFAAHATSFTTELELAWSGALDQVLLEASKNEMNARLKSLIRTIQRQANQRDTVLEGLGIDPKIPQYPMPAGEFSKLSFSPESERRHLQLRLAQLDALRNLLHAITAMQNPSGQIIFVDGRSTESWWEAGAFSTIRDQTNLLVRLSESLDTVEHEMLGQTPEGSTMSSGIDNIRLARIALSHGDVESTLLQTWLALRTACANSVSEPSLEILMKIAESPQLATGAPILRSLHTYLTKIFSTEEFDLGAATILAPSALSLISNLCLAPAEFLRSILDYSSSPHGGIHSEEGDDPS